MGTMAARLYIMRLNVLFALLSASLWIALGTAANATDCPLLSALNATEHAALKQAAAEKGGYVFAFRHTARLKNGDVWTDTLSDAGKAEAERAGKIFAQLLGNKNVPSLVIQKHYEGKTRIARTRELFSGSHPYEEYKFNDLEDLLDQKNISREGNNTFVFANSIVMNKFCDGTASCQLGCMEGVVFTRKTDGRRGVCYRFYPAEWESRNAALPSWTEMDKKCGAGGR